MGSSTVGAGGNWWDLAQLGQENQLVGSSTVWAGSNWCYLAQLGQEGRRKRSIEYGKLLDQKEFEVILNFRQVGISQALNSWGQDWI